jgi:hypothetical protein
MSESNLVAYARRELELAGLFDKDADYGGALGSAILRVVEAFSEDSHSGGSAGITIHALERLLRFKPLTPITSNPAEWMQVDTAMWQSTRNPSCFSKDGGATWYDIDEPEVAP